jgi:hypothetical protein
VPRSSGSPRLRTNPPPPGRGGHRRRGTREPLRRPEADGPSPRALRRRWSGRRRLRGHPRRAYSGRPCCPRPTITRHRCLRCGRRRPSRHPFGGATISSRCQLRPRRHLLPRPGSPTRSSPPVTSRPRSSRPRIRAHRRGAGLRPHNPRVSPPWRNCPDGGWTGRSAPPRRRIPQRAGSATARRSTRERRAPPVFPRKRRSPPARRSTRQRRAPPMFPPQRRSPPARRRIDRNPRRRAVGSGRHRPRRLRSPPPPRPAPPPCRPPRAPGRLPPGDRGCHCCPAGSRRRSRPGPGPSPRRCSPSHPWPRRRSGPRARLSRSRRDLRSHAAGRAE